MINPFAETFMIATRTDRFGLPDMHADPLHAAQRARPRLTAAPKGRQSRLMRFFFGAWT